MRPTPFLKPPGFGHFGGGRVAVLDDVHPGDDATISDRTSLLAPENALEGPLGTH